MNFYHLIKVLLRESGRMIIFFPRFRVPNLVGQNKVQEVLF